MPELIAFQDEAYAKRYAEVTLRGCGRAEGGFLLRARRGGRPLPVC